MRFFAAFTALTLAGCQSFDPIAGPFPVEGTTWILDKPQVSGESDVKIRVYASRKDCQNGADTSGPADIEECLPRVDRGVGNLLGQVALSFALEEKDGSPLYVAMTKDQLDVAHAGVTREKDEWEFIPHGNLDTGQLFIIIIDGSSSIYTTGGIDKVEKALLNPDVIDSFLPEESKAHHGVLLLRFNENVTTIDGQDPTTKGTIIEKRGRYQEMIKKSIRSDKRGFSYVYDAVTYTAGPMVDSPYISNWLDTHTAKPVIVILTDGFNNEEGSDTCASNVDRLKDSMDALYKGRQSQGEHRPTIHTVGLGTAMWPKFKLQRGEPITPQSLCGNVVDETINGDLELQGIDNRSLAWLADAGGGETFISNNNKGLAEVFKHAAAQRHKWYTIRYDVDSFYQRRSFEVRLRLKAYAQSETTATFHPSAWMDAPPGVIEPGKTFFTQTPLRRALVPLLTMLGLFTFLTFLGPASFNARRAIFRRVRRK